MDFFNQEKEKMSKYSFSELSLDKVISSDFYFSTFFAT